MDFQVNDETYFSKSCRERENSGECSFRGPQVHGRIPVYEDRGEIESLLVLEQDRQ